MGRDLFKRCCYRIFFDEFLFFGPTDSLQVDGLVAGFPCVSVSALNVDPKSFTDQKSATGAGFASIKNYIKNKRQSGAT